MKIALIRSAVHRKGGVERYVWMLAGELARRGHDVHLIARRCPELPHPSVTLHPVNVRGPFSFLKALSFASLATVVVEAGGFDVVHSCDRIFSCDIYRAGEGVHREWLEVSARYMPGWKSALKRLQKEKDLAAKKALKNANKPAGGAAAGATAAPKKEKVVKPKAEVPEEPAYIEVPEGHKKGESALLTNRSRRRTTPPSTARGTCTCATPATGRRITARSTRSVPAARARFGTGA